ncbi:MAG: hypothetical protein NTZ17_22260 [Phycisphaerae bacterium]|nr:hypothetical protein [Phycisphaerae bacterium]
MVEGLWTIEFASPKGFGTGIMVLTDKRLLGGDEGYYYSGEYTVDDHRISGKAEIVRFDRNCLSVFGDMDSFTVDLDGEVSEDSIVGVAHLSGQPDLRAQIRCKKKTEL